MRICAAGRIGAGWWLALAVAAAFGVALFTASLANASAGGQCGDESLRAELGSSLLPDCRAYELVTPSYKEGASLFVYGLTSFAANGERVIFESSATLAGTQGSGDSNPNSALYLAQRTENGWQLSPLNAPMSEFVGQLPLSGDAGTGATLWVQHTPSESTATFDLYVRQADGTFDLIGPLTPEGGEEKEPSNVIASSLTYNVHFVASTDNYKHTVFEVVNSSAQWPFDETTINEQQHSLFEYSGTNNEKPVLVGVLGGKGSSQLIATCGTTLGSELLASRYNAVSSDGETIFFTVNPCLPAPEKAEIYARKHGAMISTEPAETVHVSENECATSCGEESGKNFEGASEDGTLVYFTSTQKLTDDAVDGTASGDAAVGAGCATMPENQGGCNLYLYDFSARTAGRLKAVSLNGEVLGVVGIARDGSRVYYVSRTADTQAGENVYGMAPAAGRPNLYVYDASNEKTSFIATLGPADKRDWRRVFKRTAEVAGNSGRFLLFASTAKDLTPDDTHEGLAQLYEYQAPRDEMESSNKAEAAELVRVTKGEYGTNDESIGVNPETLEEIEGVTAQPGTFDHKSTANRSNVSVSGKTVFFVTTSQLSPRATSSAQRCGSLYEFHSDGAFTEGSVHLVSDGRDTQLFKGSVCGPQFVAMDASGSNVLFTASNPLLPSDVDGGQRDVYDARVGGGFRASAGAGSCGTGLCEGPSSAPLLPVAGSANASSEAPLAPAMGKSTGKGKRGSAGKLARALKACRAKPRARRATCRQAAQRRFGSRAADLSKMGWSR